MFGSSHTGKFRLRLPRMQRPKAGAAPGIEVEQLKSLPSGPQRVVVTCIDYGPEQVQAVDVLDVDDFLANHRPEWATVRWINVDGLADTQAIQTLAQKYDLHPLSIEDMLHEGQRPKVEPYGGEESDHQARLFIVTQAMDLVEGRLRNEQVSIFLGHSTVLTFQASRSTEWDTLRQRLKVKGSRLRKSDASFLAYSLLDALIDHCFPILEAFSERAEELEALILERSQPELLGQIHQFKRDLLLLRWVVWPMREVVSGLQREPHECVSDTTRVYLRDLYDHVIQIIDLIETYMSSVSNRMNEIMKVLTLIGTIFIPLTFLAGVYGMNFHFFPELDQPWAYPAFWGVCIATAVGMLVMFRRRRWL